MSGKFFQIYDIETYSPVDLKKYGARKYLCHKEARILTSYLINIKIPEFLEALFDITLDKDIIVAHNAVFEAIALKRFYGTGEHVFFICTSALSRWLGGPSSLQDCGIYWDLPNRKDFSGKELVRYFKTYNPDDPDWSTNMKKLFEYCKQDVITTKDLFKKLLLLAIKEQGEERTAHELLAYNQTLQSNIKGITINVDKLNRFIKKRDILLNEKNKNFETLYNINPRSPKQVLHWIQQRTPHIKILSTNATYLTTIFTKLTPEVKAFIIARQDLNSPIFKKLDVIKRRLIKNKLDPDLMHHGTDSGRYISMGVNVLNFPRGDANTSDEPKTLPSLKTSMRSLIVPSKPENKIVAIDYRQIELRMSLYTLGYIDELEKLSKGWDLYHDFATLIFNTSSVSKDQRFRGKVWVLSIGYGAFPKRLAFEVGGLQHLEAATKAHKIYLQKMFPKTHDWWTAKLKEVSDCKTDTYALRILNGSYKYLKRSRLLYTAEGRSKGIASVGGQIFSVHNQACVREILKEKKNKLLEKGYHILFDAHDEIVFDTKEKYVKDIAKIMESPISWLPNFKLQTDIDIRDSWG